MNQTRAGKGWIIIAVIAAALVCLCLGCLAAGWFYFVSTGDAAGLPEIRLPGLTPAATAESRRTGDSILRLIGGRPVTLDPALVEDATSGEYVDKVFVGLVSLDATLQIRPELAERWEVSLDGTVYTFFLRAEARFQDGRPITTADVKYSLERSCTPELGSNVAGTYLGDIVGVRERLAGRAAEIAGVKVIDERTLQITIDAPKSYFLAKLTYPTAALVDRNNIEGNSNWLQRPNGAGPYRLVSQSDEEIILAANEHYFRGKPAIAELSFRLPTGDPMTMYETGELDAVPVGVENYERVHDPTNPLHLDLVEAPALDVQYVGFNLQQPPFDDVKVRQAFAYATQRKAIIDILLKKSAQEARGILPPGLPGYNAQVAGPSYDPERARELLRASRYAGPDQLPPIVLVTSGGNTDLEEALAAMYNEVLGARIEVQQVEWRYFLRDLNQGRYAMFTLGWRADYPDPQNFLDIQFHSDSDGNYCHYSNPHVDRLLEQARLERDSARRMALYQQAEEMILSDAPWIPLYHGIEDMLVRPYVQGFSITPLGMYNLEGATLHAR